jgi:hypothetical protein
MARRRALALVVCAVAAGCGASDDTSGIEAYGSPSARDCPRPPGFRTSNGPRSALTA